MTFKFPRLARLVAEGLRYSAQITAAHEGLPWDGDGRIASMGLIRGLEAGSDPAGGAAGKRPRQR